MANCDICGKKIGFTENSSMLKIGNKMLELCENCTKMRNRLENAVRMEKERDVDILKEEFKKFKPKGATVEQVIDAIEEKGILTRRSVINQQIANKEEISTADRVVAAIEEKGLQICESALNVLTTKKEEFITKEKERKEHREYIRKLAKLNREKVRDKLERYRNEYYDDLIYCVQGNRGRSMEVYYDKVIIRVDITFGSVLTENATDGRKTIYFVDCIGLQFKAPTLTIGYLQLETASGLMNNDKSNFFNENTFTYDVLTDEILEVYDFIQMRLDEIKKIR